VKDPLTPEQGGGGGDDGHGLCERVVNGGPQVFHVKKEGTLQGEGKKKKEYGSRSRHRDGQLIEMQTSTTGFWERKTDVVLHVGREGTASRRPSAAQMRENSKKEKVDKHIFWGGEKNR